MQKFAPLLRCEHRTDSRDGVVARICSRRVECLKRASDERVGARQAPRADSLESESLIPDANGSTPARGEEHGPGRDLRAESETVRHDRSGRCDWTAALSTDGVSDPVRVGRYGTEPGVNARHVVDPTADSRQSSGLNETAECLVDRCPACKVEEVLGSDHSAATAKVLLHPRENE